jgi:hypothetical protein
MMSIPVEKFESLFALSPAVTAYATFGIAALSLPADRKRMEKGWLAAD